MLILFIRGLVCNWMVSTGVVAATTPTSVSGKAIGMGFEHPIVNMYFSPSSLVLGGHSTFMDCMLWNEISTVIGNLGGGLSFVGATLCSTHDKTAAKRRLE